MSMIVEMLITYTSNTTIENNGNCWFARRKLEDIIV